MAKNESERLSGQVEKGVDSARTQIHAFLGAHPDDSVLRSKAEDLLYELSCFWDDFRDFTDEDEYLDRKRKERERAERRSEASDPPDPQQRLPHTEADISKLPRCGVMDQLELVGGKTELVRCQPDRECIPCRMFCGVGPRLRPGSEFKVDPIKALYARSVWCEHQAEQKEQWETAYAEAEMEFRIKNLPREPEPEPTPEIEASPKKKRGHPKKRSS